MIVSFKARAIRIIGEATSKYEFKPAKDNEFWQTEDRSKPLYWEWDFKQGNPVRDRGRYWYTQEHWNEWPGLAVPLDEVPAKALKFETEPKLDEPINYSHTHTFARIRRLECEPQKGIVIGETVKREGTPQAGSAGGMYGDEWSSGYLGYPTRTIKLLEIALPYKQHNKACIQLVYTEDII